MIPHNFEIDITSGVVKISRFGSGPLLEAIRDTIVDAVVQEMGNVANEVSQEAGGVGGGGGSDSDYQRLSWWLAAEVGRWPWDTGQSSAALGRGLPISNAGAELSDAHAFIAHIPPGAPVGGDSFEYMAEIEHEGRGELPALFLLRSTMESATEDWDERLGPGWAAAAERVV